MLKKIITTIGLFVTSFGWAETNQTNQEVVNEEEFKRQVNESCSHILDNEEFKICVQIVEMEFTVVPHNGTGGGHCPGACEQLIVE